MPRGSKLRVIVDTNVTSRSKFAKYFPQEEVESLIDFLLIIGETFEPKQHVKLCRDEADDYLLDLVIEADANYLVTGDQDLLVLQKIQNCRIVDVTTFESSIL
ncbi:MAG: putative toxin-antitoxin system toxin component, PIN family [Prevotella sp.]|nr:putative toxin-antitoxin system toxin component, PIN family [Prevotella sp.]